MDRGASFFGEEFFRERAGARKRREGRGAEKGEGDEFTAVTDVPLIAEDRRHRFVEETLRDAGVEAVPMEGFAVWAAKIRPVIQ